MGDAAAPVRRIERVRLYVDLTILAKLVSRLASERTLVELLVYQQSGVSLAVK